MDTLTLKFRETEGPAKPMGFQNFHVDSMIINICINLQWRHYGPSRKVWLIPIRIWVVGIKEIRVHQIGPVWCASTGHYMMDIYMFNNCMVFSSPIIYLYQGRLSTWIMLRLSSPCTWWELYYSTSISTHSNSCQQTNFLGSLVQCRLKEMVGMFNLVR